METAKKKKNPRQIRIQRRSYVRAAIQLIFFIAMPGAFTAGFNGMKYIFQWMGQSEVLQLNSFVKSLIALMVFTIIFGRYFCGYLCSFGSLGDFVNWVSGLFQTGLLKKKKKWNIPAKVMKYLRLLKYLNLAAIVCMCAFGVYSHLKGTSPWDVFSRLCSLKSVPAGYTAGIIFLILILVGMAFEERFFCQVLCPMGAFFALLPVLPTGSLHRDQVNCIKGCNACANRCPVDLKIREDGSGSGECIHCEKCIPICPKGNLSQMEDKWIHQEFVPMIGKACLFFIMGCLMGWCRFF